MISKLARIKYSEDFDAGYELGIKVAEEKFAATQGELFPLAEPAKSAKSAKLVKSKFNRALALARKHPKSAIGLAGLGLVGAGAIGRASKGGD